MARLILAAAAVLTLAACVPTKTTPGTTTTILETHVSTLPPTSTVPTYTPPPAHTVTPLPPGTRPAKGETEQACPYIASAPEAGADSVADIVGSHVLRTTVLTATRPVGCRFYFYAGPYEAIADIVPTTFDSADAAYAAMLATAAAGTSESGRSDLIPGVDAVLYRTRFFGPDGDRDWACVFAAGPTMVVVHTQRDDISFSALRLAQVVAPKFG
jgi:hypothetical protein